MNVPDEAARWTAVARDIATAGGTPAQILGAVADRMPDGLGEGALVRGLVVAFGVPIRTAMDAIRWRGLGVAAGLTDAELNDLLAPWLPPVRVAEPAVADCSDPRPMTDSEG